ncbi:hypothetical protein [uncultured Massilia sp.]|uniref:hypothetical protein n=1 Tax=uncultured Massilia sp. TaxID=169973 RepID=UPI0025EED5AB|nr:hypothetical protein [uncultured Massilia sp.]
MFEVILQFLVEFVGEILLQILVEFLVEMGLHGVAEPFRRRPHPGLAAIGYLVFGAVAGAASLWPFPAYLVPGPWRIANLALAPVLAGLAMCAVGAWRARRGQPVLRLDRFGYGYLFALALALVRFWFAR